MKKLILIVAIIFLSSCGVTHKLTSNTQDNSVIQTEIKKDSVVNIVSLIDTTKTDNQNIEYEKIEYYPPIRNDIKLNDSSIVNKDKVQHEPNKGAIKSITKYKVVHNKEDKGVTKDSIVNKVSEDVSVEENKDITTEIKQVKRNPLQIKYIFYIFVLVLIVAAFFYIKKHFVSIKSWLEKIMNFFI